MKIRILTLLFVCVSTAAAMEKSSSSGKAGEKKFSYQSYDFNQSKASLRDALDYKQYAITEVFKDSPTANDLCKRYTVDELRKAEKDQKDIRSFERSRIHDSVHEQCVDPVARSEYHHAQDREQTACKQLAVIQQAIELQQSGKCTAEEDSSSSNDSSDCIIL